MKHLDKIKELQKELMVKSPELRKGQAFFNALSELHPTLANSIKGTALDPFYDCPTVRVLALALADKNLDKTVYFQNNWYFAEDDPEYYKYSGIHADMDAAWFDAQRSDLGVHIEYQNKVTGERSIIDNDDWMKKVLKGKGLKHLPEGIEQETLEFLKILRKEKWV